MAIKRGVRIPVTTDAAKARAAMQQLDREVEDLAARAATMGTSFRRSGAMVGDSVKANEQHLRRLGATSDRVAEAQRRKLIDSFNAIKTRGVASMAEIERAEAALQAKLARIDQRLSLRQAPAAAGGMRAVTKAGGELDGQLRDTARAIAVLDGPLGGVASRFSSLASLIGGVGVATGAMMLGTTALTTSIGGLVTKARTFEQTAAQTAQLLRQTGYDSGQTAESIERLSVALGEATLAGTQEAREAANVLLTFRSIAGDTFERTLGLAQDLSSLGMGNLTDATKQLGRALEDPAQGLTALRRSGVSFSEQQKAVIKALVETNRQAEAQSLILDVLEGQVGGAAEAAAVGLSGALDTLAERMGRLQEAAAENSLPTLTAAVNGLSESVQFGIDNLDDLTAAAEVSAGVVVARFLGPVLAAATRTAGGYASLAKAWATGNAVLLNGAAAAKAKAAAVETAAAADNAAAQASLRAAQTERDRVAATVAALEAEMRLEAQRLQAQINDTGRQARMRALVKTRADLARATDLLTQRERQLAAAQTAATAATERAGAATAAYVVAARRATIVGRGLAAVARLASGALSLVGGPMGALLLAAGYLAMRTTEYDRVQRSTNETIARAAELTNRLRDATDEQREALVKQRAEIIRNQEAEVARLEAALEAARRQEQYTLASVPGIGDAMEFVGINALARDLADFTDDLLGLDPVGGTSEEIQKALDEARDGLRKIRDTAADTAKEIADADAKAAAMAADLRAKLLDDTVASYRREIALSALAADERAKVEAADKAILELRKKAKDLGEDLTAEEEARVRALVETAEAAKGAGVSVDKVLSGLRRAWQATQAAMEGGLDIKLGAITADEDAQAKQLEHLDAYAAKAEDAARIVVAAEVRKGAAVDAWARRATAAVEDHYGRAIALARCAGQDTNDLERERLDALRDVYRQREDALSETVDRLIKEEERHRDAAVEAARDAADRIADIDSSIRDLEIGLMSEEDQYTAREQGIRAKEAEARAALAAGEYEKARDLAEEVAREAEANAGRVPDTEAARARAVEIATEHMRIAQELIGQAGAAMSEAETRAAELAGAEARVAETRLDGVRRQIAALQQATVALENVVLRVDTAQAERGLAAVRGELVAVRQEAEAAGRAMSGIGAMAGAGEDGDARRTAGGGASTPEPRRAQAAQESTAARSDALRAVVAAVEALTPGLAAARSELATFAADASAGSTAVRAGADAAGLSLRDLAANAARVTAAQEDQARAATATERALKGVETSAAGAAAALRAVTAVGPLTSVAPRARWDGH